MSRVAGILGAVALAGCSFSGGAGAVTDAAPGDDGATDDAGRDDAAEPLGICDPRETSLGACWEFDKSFDDTAKQNDVGTPQNGADFSDEGFEGQALLLNGVDQFVTVDNSLDLDSGLITVEARIRPASLPGNNQELAIFDNQAQYSLLLFDNDGRARCAAAGSGGTLFESPAGAIEVDVWTHVACSIDDEKARLYVDGDEVACHIRDSLASTTGNLGSAIGADIIDSDTQEDFFEGLIDNLRIFEETRTPAQICASAGRTDCVEITDDDNCEDNE
jgi:hypothetical protein